MTYSTHYNDLLPEKSLQTISSTVMHHSAKDFTQLSLRKNQMTHQYQRISHSVKNNYRLTSLCNYHEIKTQETKLGKYLCFLTY